MSQETITIPVFRGLDPFTATLEGFYQNAQSMWYYREAGGTCWCLGGPPAGVDGTVSSGGSDINDALKMVAVALKPDLVKDVL